MTYFVYIMASKRNGTLYTGLTTDLARRAYETLNQLEQEMIVETTRAFVENELYPHEAEVERTGKLDMDLYEESSQGHRGRSLRRQHPEEFGGAGLDTLTWLLYEKELGRANYALHWTCVARPSNILCAGTKNSASAISRLACAARRWDCLAMTEPGAGSDLRGMKATAKQDGGDWVLNGTKHFISHADDRRLRDRLHRDRRGRHAAGQEADHRHSSSTRARPALPCATATATSRTAATPTRSSNSTIAASLPTQRLGDVHKGFEVANTWLGATRLQVGATCLGRAERALEHAFCNGRWTVNSSASRSASSRASPSSWPTWRWR
jgi:acyl-CoA dehydrogenase